MRPRSVARVLVALGVTGVAILGTLVGASPAPAAPDPGEATQCHDATLPRQRTEVSTDLTVPQFDPALGTLLEVSVPTQTVHLDTDAAFENTAQSAVVFAEHMDYQVSFTSPGGLASPPAITGTIPRVPSQTLAAFDGTLDYAGPSAVTQPSTSRDESATPMSATDAPTLAGFTGAGTMPFHVATTISEVFNGGGGNVQFLINTFVSGAVRVCYRYAPPVETRTETPTPVAAAPPPAPAAVAAAPASAVAAVPRTTG